MPKNNKDILIRGDKVRITVEVGIKVGTIGEYIGTLKHNKAYALIKFEENSSPFLHYGQRFVGTRNEVFNFIEKRYYYVLFNCFESVVSAEELYEVMF